ncbi:RNA metabolism protein [Lithospermum erythrorhizon]|uniref:RNA metabolism protein n=1 Tax=Lithospermum erythrorhizon TaxID=34254 RepID=A0AAV3PJS2_LITER
MEAAAPPVSVPAQVVANAFVQQYYRILYHSPEHVHKFYQENSKLGRPQEDGSMSTTTTMDAINAKILALNYPDVHVEIRSVDAQDSFEGGVHVLVSGYLSGENKQIRNFAQTFFLAPQEKGYFVLNDIFRYVDNSTMPPANHALANEAVAPVTPETNLPPVVENHTSEQSTPSAEDSSGGEVYNPPENGDVPVVVEEEVPVAEVVNEVQDDSNMVLESSANIGETPKKSFASIVKDLKGTAAVFSAPSPVTRKPIAKSQNLVSQYSTSGNDGQISNANAIENENGQAGDADGCSIYIKGLPMNATPDMLSDVFKQFGPIKKDGIQVRSNKGFCFGFVEFELANAVEKAIEASPIAIGTRQVVVEEKKSTNSRGGSNRGRFPPGRGSGFRNEGPRGRGNYGGGRGYSRNDYGNRSGNRSGSFHRGDEYQRSDFTSNGGRGNRPVGVANGNTNMVPRVQATA